MLRALKRQMNFKPMTYAEAILFVADLGLVLRFSFSEQLYSVTLPGFPELKYETPDLEDAIATAIVTAAELIQNPIP